MPKAKKLPSGSWRCQVFDHYEKIFQKDGSIKKKRVYKSFTVEDPSPKGKKKCEAMAAEWSLKKESFIEPGNEADLTVAQALKKYIAIKSHVLSPSTLSTYKNTANVHFSSLNNIRLSDLNNSTVQKWVNDLASRRSPKTVSNVYGLLTAALYTFLPDKSLHVRLPQKRVFQGYIPSDEDIKKLIEYSGRHDISMLIAIYLAAFGTLRRSEICGLTAKDVNRKMNTVHVHEVVVLNDKNEYTRKETAKTISSDRYVELPGFVIDLLPKKGALVPYDPRSVTKRFIHIVDACNVPHFRFHDLRHYSASIMHALGIPDEYIMKRGGWSSDHTLKQIYRGTIPDYEKKFTAVALSHYENLASFETMQHAMQHEKKKAL